MRLLLDDRAPLQRRMHGVQIMAKRGNRRRKDRPRVRRPKSKAAKKMDAVERSLGDLLPEGASYAIDDSGKVTIDVKAKRGEEQDAIADVARRLNIALDALVRTK